MSDRPWYHFGHAVRSLLADVVVALAALALLMENVRPRDGGVRRVPSMRPWLGGFVDVHCCGFGWPITWGTTPRHEGMLKPVDRPRPPNIWSLRQYGSGGGVRAAALLLNAVIILAVLAATAFVTRRWLKLPRRPWQFSLLLALLLPATLAVFAMMAKLQEGIRWWLLALFFWYAVACATLLGVTLAPRAAVWSVRVCSWCFRAWMRLCARAWIT